MPHLAKHLLELASHMNLHSALQWRMIKNLLLHWGVNKWKLAKITTKSLDQILEPWTLQSQILGQ